MFHSLGLAINELPYWLRPQGQAHGNHASQGGGAIGSNATPTFTAPQANGARTAAGAHRDAASAPNTSATLQEASLKKAFSEGSPGVIGNVLKYLDDRGRLNNRALRHFILSTVVERTDAQTSACFQQVLGGLQTTACGEFGEAMSRQNFALAEALVKLDPSVADERHLREAATQCVELGRAIAHLRPDLEQLLHYRVFAALYGDHSSAPSQNMTEQRASWRQLMDRFPHRADQIALNSPRIDDGSLVTHALHHAPLPHRASFWSSALFWFPQEVANSLSVRPEAVDHNLIKYAIALGCNDVLALAYKANPKVFHEKDPEGNTAVHLAARIGNTEALATIRDFGVDVKARNAEGATPSSRAPRTPGSDLLGLQF